MVVVAAGCVPSGLSFEACLQYAIFTLEPEIIEHPYHLVFIYSAINKQAPEVDAEWLTEAHDILPKKYRRNLQRAFVLHPTFWLKAWWMKSKGGIGEDVTKKVVMCDTIAELFEELGGRTCVLPEYSYRHEGVSHGGRGPCLTMLGIGIGLE